MRTITDKVYAANMTILRVMEQYRRPVLMCSFGKDSMVLLHLVREWLFQRGREISDFPILFHREPFMPSKYQFANEVIRDWKLQVYDYSPSRTALAKANGIMEVINFYQVGQTYNYLPTGVVEPDLNEPYLCGRWDLLHKPTGTFNYPWDVSFIGHKSSDIDPLLGAVPLGVDVRQNPTGADVAFPLRHWTDADIWEYAELYGVPIHRERYKRLDSGGYVESPDKTNNPDYFACCTRCLDRDNPRTIECPKLRMQVDNISDRVPYVDNMNLSYLQKA